MNIRNIYILQFKILLILAFSIVFYFTCLFVANKLHLKKQEQLSKEILETYNSTRLHEPEKNIDNKVLGTIEIPKLNISYPIFSFLTDANLKIAPCRFYGEMPEKNSNLCIAGHNYDNDKFFSKISSLVDGDEIILKNMTHSFVYFVYDKYEVKASNLSPITDYPPKKKILTLVTCNNLNKNRIIIRALLKYTY